jgi:hypothetical protein
VGIVVYITDQRVEESVHGRRDDTLPGTQGGCFGLCLEEVKDAELGKLLRK